MLHFLYFYNFNFFFLYIFINFYIYIQVLLSVMSKVICTLKACKGALSFYNHYFSMLTFFSQFFKIFMKEGYYLICHLQIFFLCFFGDLRNRANTQIHRITIHHLVTSSSTSFSPHYRYWQFLLPDVMRMKLNQTLPHLSS